MKMTKDRASFPLLNQGYNKVFQLGRLSIGLVIPLESYGSSSVPSMEKHLEQVQRAESLGFSAVWLRDVPFHVPTFGDAGQLFDPWAYLGYLAGQTESIALGVASIVLPLRHPAHVAKAAASVDVLSGGRLLLGVASGDRPEEYPAIKANYADRGKRFRESFEYIRRMSQAFPEFENGYGRLSGQADLLPKPTGQLPLLITGGSQQDLAWIAENGDGWMIYPRDLNTQSRVINDWRARIIAANRPPQPVMQPLYVDLDQSLGDQAMPLHLGFRSSSRYLIKFLKNLEAIGVNHVALNLRFSQKDIATTLGELADSVLGEFSSHDCLVPQG